MRNTSTLLDIDLRLFDGAAGAAPAGGEGGAAQGNVGTTAKAENNGRPGSSRRAKTGASNVVYGIQEDASGTGNTYTPAAGENGQAVSKAGVSTTSDSLEAKRQAFKELIEGEYKDQYAEAFQSAFNRRFKETKGMEQTIAAQKPVLDMMFQKYGITDGDVSNLQAAIEGDTTMWENAADEAGLTVEQYKAMQKLERENAELRLMREREKGQQQAQQRLNQWYAEAEKVKEMYPTFDFQREVASRDFQGLLRSGLSVQQAYELVHMEEIKAGTARAAAETAGAQMKANIQRKAARPTENGTSSQSAVIVKNDVHNLSRADRAEIARRAQRGEKIRF